MTDIREELLSLRDEKYRVFTSSLLPGVENIIGVRLPEIKKIAARLAKSEEGYSMPENPYFEEVMLCGMAAGLKKENIHDKIKAAEDFLPHIDNWSVCDSFCSCFKFSKTDAPLLFDFIGRYVSSKSEFYVRFAAVMLLKYFINDEYIGKTLSALWQMQHPGYYAKMAQAWAISMCFVKYPERTGHYLLSLPLDDFTYDSALQKILDSRSPTPQQKDMIRAMKRKRL